MTDIVPYSDSIVDYKTYDFDQNKPNPRENPHFVPIYLFLKLAKEFGAEVDYKKIYKGIRARFSAIKTDSLFQVWFAVASATETKTVLTVSWTENDSDEFLSVTASMTGSESARQNVDICLNQYGLEAHVKTLEDNSNYSIKSNATFFHYYQKILTEIIALKI